MIGLLLVAWAWLAPSSAAPAFALPQTHRDPGCSEWHECRSMALAAAEQHEYERFHDLAWRAVQTGPPRDPSLMLLLARAQVLSGRPHDALVMLNRLAEMGIWSDAATNEEFARTRELPGWPEVAARIERLPAPAEARTASPTLRPAPSPTLRPTPSPTPAPTPGPPPGATPSAVPNPKPSVTPSPTPGPTSNPTTATPS